MFSCGGGTKVVKKNEKQKQTTEKLEKKTQGCGTVLAITQGFHTFSLISGTMQGKTGTKAIILGCIFGFDFRVFVPAKYLEVHCREGQTREI